LLGALHVQQQLRLAAIGGKDSMSGSFNELDVPPTLVSFALAPGKATLALSPEFKAAGSRVSLLEIPRDADHLPDFTKLKQAAELLHQLNAEGKILSIHAPGHAGLAVALAKMTFGNRIGFEGNVEDLRRERLVSFLIEHAEPLPAELEAQEIGVTLAEPVLKLPGESHTIDELLAAWTGTLEPVFPTKTEPAHPEVTTFTSSVSSPIRNPQSAIRNSSAKPKVLVPAFPGTNSEYDSARAFNQAGGDAEIFVFRNLTAKHVEESLQEFADKIRESQILMFPGGFSAGDEPDGSGKFIATVLRNPRVADAVMDLIKNRDGLILGICNGFQAIIKTGLVPYGEIREPAADAPTLTFNDIGRHISCYAHTRVSSVLSPWLAHSKVGDIHTIPLSHGEGKFLASPEVIAQLAANGQIATQYCDENGVPSMDIAINPNGSMFAIEGISSPCGRVFGKMGHTERRGINVARNIPGEKYQPLFKAGVEYFL
jgi:phosphoribosylformylglycinamidine synthase